MLSKKALLKTVVQIDPRLCSELKRTMGNIIASGGYGDIVEYGPDKIIKVSNRYNRRDEKNSLDQCINNQGCSDDILLEGLILYNLNSLNSEHFPQFYGLYECDNTYLLVMEKIHDAIDFTSLLKQGRLDDITRLTILFQITYALHIAWNSLHFVHGDLIGKNILIKPVKKEFKEYVIRDDNGIEHSLYLNNNGICVVLIDFGFSRMQYELEGEIQELFKVPYNQEWYPELEDLFQEGADICKVYGNPNFRMKAFKDVSIETDQGISTLSDIISSCNFKHWSYVSVPPYPSISSSDILLSSLFEPLK